jgi:hypothetical protein
MKRSEAVDSLEFRLDRTFRGYRTRKKSEFVSSPTHSLNGGQSRFRTRKKRDFSLAEMYIINWTGCVGKCDLSTTRVPPSS